MGSKKADTNSPFIPEGVFSPISFAAGKDGVTLRVILNDPNKTVVWIKSQMVWSAYGLPGRKHPKCGFEPPEFILKFEDGTSLAWDAKLGHDPETGELLLYDLKKKHLS